MDTSQQQQQRMLTTFLTEIQNSIRAKNGYRIADLIQLDVESLDPARQKPYADLNAELNRWFPKGNDDGLAARCREALPTERNGLGGGGFRTSFTECLMLYFRYLRDFATVDNRGKAMDIRSLTSQCIMALGDSKYGVIMIPIVLSFSRVLAKIATNLDRNPNLLLQQQTTIDANETGGAGGSKVSFVESTANVLRDAFIKCLAGSPGSSRTSRPAPDDKRYGIYLTANSCLKLLFQCRKIRNAQQMFTSIDAQSPPLSFYPAAQRVTYLYYLGRYHFGNNHFYRAQIALDAAYRQCHRDARKHRRLILIYLIASNMCLGRLPSQQLFALPEAQGLADYFMPLSQIIKSGDLGALETLLNVDDRDNVRVAWFLRKRILLQLQNRCEVLTWRSLIRKVFIISGFQGENKLIPFLRLPYVRAAARWSLTRQIPSPPQQRGGHSGGSLRSSKSTYTNPEFDGIDQAVAETGFDLESGVYHDDMIGKSQSHLQPTTEEDEQEQSPTDDEVESVFLGLIQQGFLRGFVQHSPSNNPRFAIPGASAGGGPVAKGFPNIWATINSKVSSAQDGINTDGSVGGGDGNDVIVVPGWIKEESFLVAADGTTALRAGAGGASLGGVVRLSGARPVGVGS